MPVQRWIQRMAKFKKGNKIAKGGARPNTGPKPDWLKAQCESIFKREKLIEFMADVASGKKVDTQCTIDGRLIPIPASVKNRLQAVEFLKECAWGKAAQSVEVSGTGGGPISWVIKVEGVPQGVPFA